MNHFNISFVIPASRLSTIIQVLSKEVEDLKILQVGNGTVATVEPQQGQRKRPINRLRGSKVDDLLREFLSDGQPHTLKEMGEYLGKNKWSPNSVSPSMSAGAKEGWVVKTAPSTYQLRTKR